MVFISNVIACYISWWFEYKGEPFSYLLPNEQWALHAYYQPYKDLSDEQLLQHRRRVTKKQPSLPARAGKAFVNLAAGKQTGVTSGKHGKRQISVRAIVNPEIDVKQLSRALVQLAIEQARQETEKRKAA